MIGTSVISNIYSIGLLLGSTGIVDNQTTLHAIQPAKYKIQKWKYCFIFVSVVRHLLDNHDVKWYTSYYVLWIYANVIRFELNEYTNNTWNNNTIYIV